MFWNTQAQPNYSFASTLDVKSILKLTTILKDLPKAHVLKYICVPWISLRQVLEYTHLCPEFNSCIMCLPECPHPESSSGYLMAIVAPKQGAHLDPMMVYWESVRL